MSASHCVVCRPGPVHGSETPTNVPRATQLWLHSPEPTLFLSTPYRDILLRQQMNCASTITRVMFNLFKRTNYFHLQESPEVSSHQL